MRLLAAAAALTIGGAAVVALAQPRTLIRPNNRDARTESRPGFSAHMCSARRNAAQNEERRHESMQAEAAGIEAELSALQRRLDDLKRRRDDLKRDLRTQERRAKSASDGYKKQCAGDENCEVYDQRVDELEGRGKGVEAELDEVRKQIGDNRREMATLKSRIEPLAREYGDKKCNNLVPGETEDAVAERCLAIFMEWNRMQGDLNRANNRLPELRARYEQQSNELATLEKRAQGYQGYMEKNCSSSARLSKVRTYSTVRQRASTVGKELDALVDDIASIRGVKITVTAQ